MTLQFFLDNNENTIYVKLNKDNDSLFVNYNLFDSDKCSEYAGELANSLFNELKSKYPEEGQLVPDNQIDNKILIKLCNKIGNRLMIINNIFTSLNILDINKELSCNEYCNNYNENDNGKELNKCLSHCKSIQNNYKICF